MLFGYEDSFRLRLQNLFALHEICNMDSKNNYVEFSMLSTTDSRQRWIVQTILSLYDIDDRQNKLFSTASIDTNQPNAKSFSALKCRLRWHSQEIRMIIFLVRFLLQLSLKVYQTLLLTSVSVETCSETIIYL